MNDGIVRTAETEGNDRPLLRFHLINDAPHLRYLDSGCHLFSYAGLVAGWADGPNTSASVRPLSRATVCASGLSLCADALELGTRDFVFFGELRQPE